jgi:hypothetical protein
MMMIIRELVEREAATPSWVYECLGIEKKQATKPHKKDTVESIPVAESIDTEQSSTPTIQVV